VGIPLTVVTASGDRCVVVGAIHDSEGISALREHSSGNSPTADMGVFKVIAVPVGHTPSKRQIVCSVALDRVRNIEVGVAVVGRRIVANLPRLGSTTAAPTAGILAIEEVRPYVVEAEQQAVRKVLADDSLHGVVIGGCVVVIATQRAPEWEGPIRLHRRGASCYRIQCCQVCDLVNVRGELQIAGVAPDISERYRVIAEELMFQAQLPLTD